MRIMYLLFSFTVGGTERLVANICNQMKTQGEDIHLFVVNDLINEQLLNTLDKGIHIKLLKRKAGSKDRISPLIQVAKYIRKNKIDVVHCNSFNAPELLILSKLVNPKCRIISTIHGMGQFEGVSKYRIALKNWICDKFIGISDAVKNDIIKAGINENKVLRIYNGIDVTKYTTVEMKPFDKEHAVIGCVARIMPAVKGQDILLKAVNRLKGEMPGMTVLFAGGVAEQERKSYEELQKYIKDNALSSNVNFLGNVDDIPEFLNMIDICVVPSRSEGFGLALIEALSMGVPCIASSIAGPREIIKNEGVGILFESENEIDLEIKIQEIILNYKEIKRATWEHKEIVKRHFSIQSMCQKLINVYE